MSGIVQSTSILNILLPQVYPKDVIIHKFKHFPITNEFTKETMGLGYNIDLN